MRFVPPWRPIYFERGLDQTRLTESACARVRKTNAYFSILLTLWSKVWGVSAPAQRTPWPGDVFCFRFVSALLLSGHGVFFSVVLSRCCLRSLSLLFLVLVRLSSRSHFLGFESFFFFPCMSPSSHLKVLCFWWYRLLRKSCYQWWLVSCFESQDESRYYSVLGSIWTAFRSFCTSVQSSHGWAYSIPTGISRCRCVIRYT